MIDDISKHLPEVFEDNSNEQSLNKVSSPDLESQSLAYNIKNLTDNDSEKEIVDILYSQFVTNLKEFLDSTKDNSGQLDSAFDKDDESASIDSTASTVVEHQKALLKDLKSLTDSLGNQKKSDSSTGNDKSADHSDLISKVYDKIMSNFGIKSVVNSVFLETLSHIVKLIEGNAKEFQQSILSDLEKALDLEKFDKIRNEQPEDLLTNESPDQNKTDKVVEATKDPTKDKTAIESNEFNLAKENDKNEKVESAKEKVVDNVYKKTKKVEEAEENRKNDIDKKIEKVEEAKENDKKTKEESDKEKVAAKLEKEQPSSDEVKAPTQDNSDNKQGNEVRGKKKQLKTLNNTIVELNEINQYIKKLADIEDDVIEDYSTEEESDDKENKDKEKKDKEKKDKEKKDKEKKDKEQKDKDDNDKGGMGIIGKGLLIGALVALWGMFRYNASRQAIEYQAKKRLESSSESMITDEITKESNNASKSIEKSLDEYRENLDEEYRKQYEAQQNDGAEQAPDDNTTSNISQQSAKQDDSVVNERSEFTKNVKDKDRTFFDDMIDSIDKATKKSDKNTTEAIEKSQADVKTAKDNAKKLTKDYVEKSTEKLNKVNKESKEVSKESKQTTNDIEKSNTEIEKNKNELSTESNKAKKEGEQNLKDFEDEQTNKENEINQEKEKSKEKIEQASDLHVDLSKVLDESFENLNKKIIKSNEKDREDKMTNEAEVGNYVIINKEHFARLMSILGITIKDLNDATVAVKAKGK